MAEDLLREHTEQILTAKTYSHEFPIAEANAQAEVNEFEEYVNLIDSIRGDKDYDWMSDVRVPEFIAHILTQTSMDVDQYFSTRDFTDVYLEDESEEAIASAAASRELINRTLNQRHLHHYLKFVRSKIINHLSGRCFVICKWEKKMKMGKVGENVTIKEKDEDVYGEPIVDETVQVRGREIGTEDVIGEIPVIDRFNYEIVDHRNIFTTNKYTYSIQDEPYVYVRQERTLEQLEAEKDIMGYMNLDKLEKLLSPVETQTSSESYNKDDGHQKAQSPSPEYDVIHRFGKFWCIAEESDEHGNPTKITYGIDSDGKKREGAELHELVMTWAVSGGSAVLIRYIPQPYIDSHGVPYRPLIRGLCYVHPTSGNGVGDGKHVKELQYALDDTFNMNNDRVKLATFPTLLVPRLSFDNNADLYIEPGHNIPYEADGEIKELKIEDNAIGALNTMSFLKNQMQQVDSIYPTTMGDVPGEASTTATAVAGAGIQSTKRGNYKALTYENTFLTELYWMINQMTYQFAHMDTAEKLLGDKIMDFNPQLDYYYKPVSQSIETEQSKNNKINNFNTLLGYISNIQHPDVPKMINKIVVNISKLMGDEFVDVSGALLNENIPVQGQSAPQAVESGMMGAPSNQNGLPITAAEQTART